MEDDDNRSSTPKLVLGEISRSSSPAVTSSTPYPVSVRQQMARIKQMEQPSPSGSTDGELTAPLTPGGVTPGGAVGSGPGKRKPPKVHRRNGRGETPLHVAAKKGDVIACEELVAEGAEVNQSDNAGWTPLHEAASNNRVDCVTFLLEKGADPNARSQFGDVPLHDAVHCNYIRLVWTLLRAGAEIDDRCLTDNEENQRKEEQSERAKKVYALLTSDPLPSICPESEEEEEDSEEERKKEKEKEKEDKEIGKEKKDKRKKKDKEDKKKHKESSLSTPRSSSSSSSLFIDKLVSSPLSTQSTQSSSASSSKTSLQLSTITAATTVFESPQTGTVGGGGTSAGGMHAPHLPSPSAHHSPSMATQIMKQTDQQLSVSTEHNERRLEDVVPSSSRYSIPATTPISVIVGEGEEEEVEEEGEEGEIMSEEGTDTNKRESSSTLPSASLLSIADEVGDDIDDDDDEGKLMIDEGDEEGDIGEGEGREVEDTVEIERTEEEEEEEVVEEEEEESPQPTIASISTLSSMTTPIVNVQPPTPIVEKRMELIALERDEDEERDSVTRDSDHIDELAEEISAKEDVLSSRAYSEDPPSTSSTSTAKKRKKAGDRPPRKSDKGANKRTSTGIGAWAKNRKSAEPEMSSSAAAAVAAAIMADDPFEFHDGSSPDSRMSRGVTMDRELSAPPVPKRQRIDRTQSPSPSRDMDMEEDDDEDARQSGKKVPPLRLVLSKQRDDGEAGGEDEAIASSSQSTPIPSSNTRKQARGRPGGRRGGEDEGSAQRMTRSKVRQSGRGLDETEGGGKRKRGRQNLIAVEEETGGEEGEGDYSAVPTPLMAGGEGEEIIGGGGGADIEWAINNQPTMEQAVYEITTQSTLLARVNLDKMVNAHISDLYVHDRRSGNRWEPSPLQLSTFITYNHQYTIASRPPPPGGWPPMVSAQQIAEEKERREKEEAEAAIVVLGDDDEQAGSTSEKKKDERSNGVTTTVGDTQPEIQVKKNRFEAIHEEMRELWDELEEERAQETAQMESDCVTLRLSIERAVIIRERTMKNLMDKLTFCKFLKLKETCNPHSLLESQKLPDVERDVAKFVAHHETRIEELWKRHRFRAGHLAGMQVSKWRELAQKVGIQRGLKRQCRAFPEIIPVRVSIPPIEDFVLIKSTEGETSGTTQ